MNMKKRIKNKVFWITLIPAVILMLQVGLELFGIVEDFTWLSDRLINVVNAAFGVLVVLGVVVDPTTPGVKDGKQNE